MSVYTDGSGIDGHIGASAVTLRSPRCESSPILQKRTQYMGKDTESTVYAAELKGIFLALQILQATPSPHCMKVIIFTDNQSALKAIHHPGTTSGQYILEELLQLLTDVVFQGIDVELHWIPAHQGISGNEAADLAAKEVARNGIREHNALAVTKTLLTTAKRTIHISLHRDWDFI